MHQSQWRHVFILHFSNPSQPTALSLTNVPPLFPQEAKASAARHAGNLIKNLDADTKFSRVMQGNEGPEFTSFFPGEKLTFLDDEADLPPPPPAAAVAAPVVVAPEQESQSVLNGTVITNNSEEEVVVQGDSSPMIDIPSTTTEPNVLDSVPPSTPTDILLSDAILKGTPGMSQQTEQEEVDKNPQEEDFQSSVPAVPVVAATDNGEVSSSSSAITTTALDASTPPPDDDGDEATSPAKKVAVPPTPPPEDDDVGDVVEKVEQLAIGSSDVEKKKKKKKNKKYNNSNSNNNNSQNVEKKKEEAVVVAPLKETEQQQEEEQEPPQIKTMPPSAVETTNDKVSIPSSSVITTTPAPDTNKPISPKVSQTEFESMAQKKAAFMSRLSQDSGNNNNNATSPSPSPAAVPAAAKAWNPSPVATSDAAPVVAVSQLMKVTIPAGSKIISYEELKNMKLESGIDMTQKESYLSDEEFEKVFGKSKEVFTGQPRWRQQIAKKTVGLF